MLTEVIEHLDVHSQYDYIDCTFGGGGYTRAILERNGPVGRVLAIDADEDTIKRTSESLQEFGSRLVVQCGNFRDIKLFADAVGFVAVAGIVYDLGLSSDLLAASGRGFSFLADEPLDMRFSISQDTTAEQIVNSLKEKELADIIWTYGEERYSRRIAKAIYAMRKKSRITTTLQLCSVIASAVPGSYRNGRMHYATRTFQALRIAVNDELRTLEESLVQSYDLLMPGGRIVIVSFHSLEDRIVKNIFKKLQKESSGLIHTKKPIEPSRSEILSNPRSRSAKMRCIQKVVSPQQNICPQHSKTSKQHFIKQR